MATSKRRKGRPLKSREVNGYDNDLGHLDRLEKACFLDPRVTPGEYVTLQNRIQDIKGILRRFNTNGENQ